MEYTFNVTMDDTAEDKFAAYPGQFGEDTLTIFKTENGTYSWYSDAYDGGEDGFKTIEDAKADYICTMKNGEFENIYIEES